MLSEHNLFTLKRKGTLKYTYILYCKSLNYAYFVSLPHGAMGWPAVCDYVFLKVNNILFKYKVHRDTTDTSYIQYNTFERDTEISLRLVRICFPKGII